ncbi:MAG: adenosylmethionine decarboxylase [Candidatus Dojkabacteria bacterium]|nr:adenosylmethionine decarboxylase [Candidatus Dojkabacteria bacterium]
MKKIKNNKNIIEINYHLLKDKKDIFAGRHILLDMFSEKYSKDMDEMKNILKISIEKSKATIIYDYFHKFGEQGYTGVFILSESHLSIHTWPEVGLITIDSYMCGVCDPKIAIDSIIEMVKPERHEIKFFKRGILKDIKNFNFIPPAQSDIK